MTRGRPTKYKPEYCALVVDLGKQGKSPAQIASAIGVSRPTLLEWASVHDEFSTALTRAKTEEQAWWEDQGQEGLVAERFNAHLWSKSVQARFRDDYTERRDHTHTGLTVVLESDTKKL